ncbi:MAG: redoxin domain-containing protein [Desulfobacterales bacterium]|nr:redoxin domain-containing protein [Desulfobacterales bacterium]
MRDRAAVFHQTGASIVLVGLGTTDQSERFKAEFNLKFPIICDPKGELFETYGLKRTGVLGLVSPLLILKGLGAMADGYTMGVPQGDVRRLSGVFIIDTQGRIRFAHRGKNPADHPETDDLLASLSALTGRVPE